MQVANPRVLALISVLMAPLLMGAAPADQQDVVIRFRNAAKSNVASGTHLVIYGMPVMGGRAVNLMVQNIDNKNPKYDPDKTIEETVSALKPGDLVKVSYSTDNNGLSTLRTITPYTATPADDVPNGFAFVETFTKTENKVDNVYVTLIKYGQRVTAMIPSHKTKQGDMEADPQMQADAGKMKEGDTVLAELIPTNKGALLKKLEPYTTPEQGKLVKVSPAAIDDLKGFSVDIDQDGKPVTLLVPGHAQGKTWVSDTTILAAARRLRPGSEVLFRKREDGDKTWLRDIEAAPKPAAGTGAGAAGKSEK